MTEQEIIQQRLLAPFPTSTLDLKPLDGSLKDSKAVPYCYPDIRAVTDRLTAVLGSENLQINVDNPTMIPYPATVRKKNPANYKDKSQPEYLELEETHFKSFVSVSISAKMGDEWVTRSNVGEAEKKSESMTTAYAQAFKRAAVLFGVTRYLYDIKLPSFAYTNFKFDYNAVFNSQIFSDQVTASLKASGFLFKCEVTGETVDWKTAATTVTHLGRVLCADEAKKIIQANNA